jgi:AbrB family looped-hinge helix DNA binding protein
MTSTISNNGGVIIPAKFRKKYNLVPGTKVIIVDYGGSLSIIPALKNPIKQGRGLLKAIPSLTKDLFQEHDREKSGDRASD